MKEVRQVVFDTETTGFDYSTGDRLIEFGAVELINRKKTGRVLYFCVDPEREVPEEAFKVHGWNRENLIIESGGKKFADRARETFEFLKGAEIIAHNAKFDIGFIDGEMERAGIYHEEGIKKISEVCTIRDTVAMAQDLFPGRRVNLDALCKIYGIVNARDNEDNDGLHGALVDAEILTSVYLRMSQQQATLEIDSPDSKPKVTSGRAKIDIQEIPVEISSKLRALKLSDESKEEHRNISRRITKESGEDYNWGF